MFFDRLGNSVTGEEPIVEEPIVESYYDPNRPVRPGFEKPQPIQEEVIEEFYVDETCDTYEDCDSIEVSIENIVEYSEMDIDEMSDYIQEQVITESKKTHKQRFLERNKYDPETGTYETDILDENGNKIRVPLEISADGGDVMRYDVKTGKPIKIVINRKTAKSKNWNSQVILKHEEGHVAQHMGRRSSEISEAKSHIKRNNIENVHGTPERELDADRYAAEHTSKRSVVKMFERVLNEEERYNKKKLNELKRALDDIKTLSEESFRKQFRDKRLTFNLHAILNKIKEFDRRFDEYLTKKQKYIDNYDEIIQAYKILRKSGQFDEMKIKDIRKEFATELRYVKKCIRIIDDKLKKLSDNTEKDSQECLNIIKSEIIESYEKICQVCANDIKPRIQYVKSLMINESYIDEDEFVSRKIILEEKINAAERNELDDDDFGLVYTDEDGKKVRKYPLTDKDGKLDENHIRQAVRFFNHCPKEHQHQLALKILHAAHKLGLDTTKWDTVNKAAEEKDDK